MTARDQLPKEIEVTERLLMCHGFSADLRQKLFETRMALEHELEELDRLSSPRTRRAKVIEFSEYRAKKPK